MRVLALKVRAKKIFEIFPFLSLCKIRDPATKAQFPYKGHHLKYFSGGPLNDGTYRHKSCSPEGLGQEFF